MRAQGHIPVRRQRKDGTNGTSVTITSTEVKYATSAQYVQPSSIAESSWSSNYPTSLSEGTWLHSRTKVTYSNGTSTLTYGSSRVGKNGADAFVVDLENQMSSIALNAEGFSVGAYDKYFKVRAYYGSTSVLNACTISESHDDSDIEVTTDAFKTTGVRVQISDETMLSAQNDITLTVTHPTYGTRTVILTLAAVKAGSEGTPAKLYELLPSLSVVNFARTAAGALTPTSRPLTMSILKTEGSTPEEQTISASGLTVRYSVSSMPSSKTAGTAWPSDGLTINSSDTYTNIYVAAFDSSGKLVDKETIPVVKDGARGDDGTSPIFADLTNEHGGVACDKDGNTTSEQSISTKAQLYVGNALQTLTSIVCEVEGIALGTSYTDNYDSTRFFRAVSYPSTGTITVYVRKGAYIKTEDIDITISATIGGSTVSKDLKLSISGAWAGENGEPATIYELLPSVEVVSRDSDGIPLYDSINFKVKKSVGSTFSEVSNWQTEGLTLYHNIGSDDVSDGTVAGATKSVSGIQNGLYSENDKVEWILKKGSTVVDRESIGSINNGRNGDSQEDYFIRSTVGSVTVAANNTSANLTTTIDFWKKVAGEAEEAYSCYWSIYRRKGTTYSRINYGSSKTTSQALTNIATTYNDILYDAFVVFISDTLMSSNSLASAAPTSYLAKLEIQINKLGDTGPVGPGGEVYSIMSTMGSITVDSNTNTATFSGSLTFWKKVGSAAKTAYSCHCSLFRKKGSSYYYLTRLDSKATGWSSLSRSINAGTYDALVICIYDSATTVHSDYLAELEIPVYKHGDTGPTYYPCGIYDNEQTYTKSGTRTPLVFVDDPNMATWNEYAQAYGEYWYLVKDTNVVNNVHYAPSDENDYWARAENYGVVMVGAQFARFAKNGAGVMAGDYFYSANGRINGVERVDGEGADGNAVSASNPPAYTRFMGDPTIQNGYFNRTNIQGPIANDKAQLATIYVLRGVTLNVRITGTTYYDGTNTKYGYFNIYKGSTAMCSAVWIYRLRRTVTLTFTAAQSGEYTIVYYGTDASTKASFMANWELTGHFYPNWWVNLKEGKMHGAKDKFILDGDGDIKVDGALMSHKVKLVATPSHYVTYPEHAAYESNYWSTEGMVKMYEAESNGYPVRIYEGESPAVYYGLRNCRLLYDQVYVGCALGSQKKVWVFLPPPHLFVGQRIEITNMASNIPSDHSWSGVFVTLDYMDYTRTDYSEGVCLTGQEAYFEDDDEGEHDNDGENGMPYICNVPERGGAGPIHAAGIWTGETIQSSGASVFTSNLENELDISDYEWIELTAVEGPFWKYKDTQYWEDTIKYNAYWMLTKWKKREE